MLSQKKGFSSLHISDILEGIRVEITNTFKYSPTNMEYLKRFKNCYLNKDKDLLTVSALVNTAAIDTDYSIHMLDFHLITQHINSFPGCKAARA
jgi:hypothetical protein